jgi:hypothetical protein
MVQCFSSKQGTLGLIARTAFKKKKSGMAVDAVIPATLEAEIGKFCQKPAQTKA